MIMYQNDYIGEGPKKVLVIYCYCVEFYLDEGFIGWSWVTSKDIESVLAHGEETRI